ncbi:unnamed protein product [Schistosoma guineensis]|nr:unnamed protein product [Schistosoma guineensis]
MKSTGYVKEFIDGGREQRKMYIHRDNARVGDQFMRNIQPIASKVPYMTCVGNHEAAYNFSNYKARFTMPGGDGESQFYSHF